MRKLHSFMEEGRREIVYVSPEYTGVHRIIHRGMGVLERSDSKLVDEWVKTNSIGEVKMGRHYRTGDLIFDGNALCNIHIGTINKNPRPSHGEEVKYRVQVHVLISPRGVPIPEGLAKALEGYSQKEE